MLPPYPEGLRVCSALLLTRGELGTLESCAPVLGSMMLVAVLDLPPTPSEPDNHARGPVILNEDQRMLTCRRNDTELLHSQNGLTPSASLNKRICKREAARVNEPDVHKPQAYIPQNMKGSPCDIQGQWKTNGDLDDKFTILVLWGNLTSGCELRS